MGKGAPPSLRFSHERIKEEMEKVIALHGLFDRSHEDEEKEYKDVVSKILGRRKEVKEAVTTGGIEYGEQDWDVQHRLENSYPNL